MFIYNSTLAKPTKCAVVAFFSVISVFAHAQVETATSTPAKVYAATGGTFNFNIAYTGGEVATTDVAISYTANTTAVSIIPSATCISPATPAPYDSANPNEKYVLWEPASGTYPANCGGAAAAAAMVAFSGTATTFPAGGSYVIQVLNNASLGAPNVTTNDVTVCQKTTVSGVSTANIVEGATATFTANFAAAVPAGCGGFAIPGTLTTSNKGSIISGGTCSNVADAATNCTFTVTTVDNAISDGTLPVTLTVTNSTASSVYVSTNQSATSQVADNEVGVSVAATTASANETGPVNGLLTFTRVGPTAGTLAITSAITGTAANPADYTFTAGTCTAVSFAAGTLSASFAAGDATCTVNVVVVDDVATESAETVIVGVPSPGGTGNAATVTIADNDGPPSVSVAVAGSPASEEGGVLTYTFTRTGNPGQIAAALNGVAITAPAAGARFNTSCATPINFAAGSTIATCTYTGIGNTALDGNVNVTVAVGAGSGYTVGSPASAVGVITDNEIGVSVAASVASITEGGLATFTLSCTGSGTFAVDFSVNAIAGDTGPTPASPVNLTCGTPQNVTVQTAENTTPADTRSLTLAITSVGLGAAIVPGQGTASVTVLDNDGLPVGVPTMGIFGLGLLGLLMAGVAGLFQRRRK
jgi:large repetitive protein